jgi:hypothetical protein
VIKKCCSCNRDSQFLCVQCNNPVCAVHVRIPMPQGDYKGEFCSINCIWKYVDSHLSEFTDYDKEAIDYLTEVKEYRTKPAQKKSKEITTIELNYEDNVNLRRILYFAEKYLKLNIKLRETAINVKYQTK